MKIIIIDGQGGKIGKMVVAELKTVLPQYELIAIGTNSIATVAMLRSGADFGATGENPVIYNCSDADIIIGSIGILSANSFHGEITPKMALAVGQSRAKKILIPINKCNIRVPGVQEMPYNDLIQLVGKEVKKIVDK